MISEELAEFVRSGVSMLVGTRDARLQPESARAVGARVHGSEEVSVFVPVATGGTTVTNLRDNGRIAVCFARVRDHASVQLKGSLVELAETSEADRPLVDAYRKAFAESLGRVGVPHRLTLRVSHWPCHVVRFRVVSAFDQTPGPGAGDPLRAGASGGLA